jgi:Niemann-Pick C1 protein
LPFVVFGVGLDDIFIIAGAYERTDPKLDPSKRVQITMQDVGGTIMMTTLTTATAFALGCISSIPSVFWLCCYAFPTILMGFVYQITFFVALMVIDGRRVEANRYDCLVCYSSKVEAKEAPSILDQGSPKGEAQFIDRMMGKYADYLLLPKVKALVIVCFAVLFGLCAYSTTLLTQEFDWTSVLPKDSYIVPYKQVTNGLTNNRDLAVDVYFRYVNFSEAAIRSQMRDYIEDLVELPYISAPPVFFWPDDFDDFTNEYEIKGIDFEKQMDRFLADPVYSSLYKDDMVRDATTGRVTTTRTKMFFDGVNSHDMLHQMKVLLDEHKVTGTQPINQGSDDWKFFTHCDKYFSWEFYSVAVRELVLSTILGVAAISGLTILLIPHWSAVLFVAPLLIVMYVDLLGVAQFAGLHINAVTYVSMVMSIGLIVDYLMHVALRFFETPGSTRQAKTKSVLQTMGSSIMVGCLSTILGMVPLAFSTSDVFRTVFIIFLGLTTLGMGHGLILLPVILATVGPIECVPTSTDKSDPIVESNKAPQTVLAIQEEIKRSMKTASTVQSSLSDKVDGTSGASKDVWDC